MFDRRQSCKRHHPRVASTSASEPDTDELVRDLAQLEELADHIKQPESAAEWHRKALFRTMANTRRRRLDTLAEADAGLS